MATRIIALLLVLTLPSWVLAGNTLNISNPIQGNGTEINGGSFGDTLGTAVDAVGDINGDGVDDVIVGARTADPGGRSQAGKAHLVFGGSLSSFFSVAALNGTTGVSYHGIAQSDRAGRAVAGIGDINQDGINDLAIGARRDLAAEYDEAYVVFGSTDPFSSPIELSALNNPQGFVVRGPDTFSPSIALGAAGDFNGDGIDDFCLGAASVGSGGMAYVLLGRSTPFPDVVDLESLSGTQGLAIVGDDFDDIGDAIRGVGDVNDDGLDDVLIRAGETGEAYIIFGHAGPYSQISTETLNGNNGVTLSNLSVNGFETSVGPAGDINGDGIDDLIFGSPSPGDGFFIQPGIGSADIVFGRPSWPASVNTGSLPSSQGLTVTGTQLGDGVGVSVDGGGDFNGDGIDDVLIGAEVQDPAGLPSGRNSYLLFGRSGGPQGIQTVNDIDGENGLVFVSASAADAAGASVRFAGDVNDDGVSDVIIGAEHASNRGEAYLVYGNSPPTSRSGSVGNGTLDLVAGDPMDPGVLLFDLFAANYQDVSDPLSGIAITENASTPQEGVWQYQLSGSAIWNALGTGHTASSAFLLPVDARLRFSPDTNYLGTAPALMVRLWDGRWHGTLLSTVNTETTPPAVSAFSAPIQVHTPNTDAFFLSGFE